MADILLTAVVNKSVEIAANLLVQEGTRLHWLREDIERNETHSIVCRRCKGKGSWRSKTY